MRKITQRKASISPVGKVESLEQICPSYNLANKKLTYIPVVFMLSRIWGTLRFLILLKENDRTARYFGLALSPLQVFIHEHHTAHKDCSLPSLVSIEWGGPSTASKQSRWVVESVYYLTTLILIDTL